MHSECPVGAPPPPPDAPAAERQVISGAIASDGVIGLFRAAGLPDQNLGILSEDFLERLAALPHKNLALETLRGPEYVNHRLSPTKAILSPTQARPKQNTNESRGIPFTPVILLK